MNCARSLTAQSLRPTLVPAAVARTTASSRGLRTRNVAPAQTDNPTNPDDKYRFRTIEAMPFQTYRFALDVILKDRLEKLELVEKERKKIQIAMSKPDAKPDDRHIKSMHKHLEYLRIQADMNNPRVKYNFDRGKYGMNKPIYRYLLERKWKAYRRPVLMQRLTQMDVIPDVLPKIDPVVDVQVRFRGREVKPGAFVDSLQSEATPTLKVNPFTEGKMLCTVAVVDSDVPNIETDGFDRRLHWLVCNIPISPTQTQAIGTGAKPSDVIVDWLPPHVQKGSPYHRYIMIVFKQPGPIESCTLKKMGSITRRDGFGMRGFGAKYDLDVIGAFMFRGQWDDHTKEVMQRHDLEGWDKMFVRRKGE